MLRARRSLGALGVAQVGSAVLRDCRGPPAPISTSTPPSTPPRPRDSGSRGALAPSPHRRSPRDQAGGRDRRGPRPGRGLAAAAPGRRGSPGFPGRRERGAGASCCRGRGRGARPGGLRARGCCARPGRGPGSGGKGRGSRAAVQSRRELSFSLPNQPDRRSARTCHSPLPSPSSGEGGGMRGGDAGSGARELGRRMHSAEISCHQVGCAPQAGAVPRRAEQSGGRPSGERKERVGELVALCLSVAWLINFGASCSKQKPEGNGLCAKEGFSRPCQLLQFLQRGSRRTVDPAAESSSSSGGAHMYTRRRTSMSADFPWSRLLALGQGDPDSKKVKNDCYAQEERRGRRSSSGKATEGSRKKWGLRNKQGWM